eukprot:scaffold71897_cov31-Tisochrysis_lutea.AAC.3
MHSSRVVCASHARRSSCGVGLRFGSGVAPPMSMHARSSTAGRRQCQPRWGIPSVRFVNASFWWQVELGFCPTWCAGVSNLRPPTATLRMGVRLPQSRLPPSARPVGVVSFAPSSWRGSTGRKRGGRRRVVRRRWRGVGEEGRGEEARGGARSRVPAKAKVQRQRGAGWSEGRARWSEGRAGCSEGRGGLESREAEQFESRRAVRKSGSWAVRREQYLASRFSKATVGKFLGGEGALEVLHVAVASKIWCVYI